MASMKLSLFTWQLIFVRDHFFNDTDTESGLGFWKWTIPRPSPVSFFWVNDTNIESGLVFLKLTILRPSLVSIFLSERYRYQVWSRFLVNNTDTESGLVFLNLMILRPSPILFFWVNDTDT